MKINNTGKLAGFITQIYKTATLLIVLLLYSSISYTQNSGSEYGDFPYEQPFLSTTGPSEITRPDAGGTATNAAQFTAEGLLLTPAATGQFGAAFINNRQFGSVNGVKIEFEYMMYGGTGGDGISMFLFDASTTIPSIGAPGAGIGYAYNLTDGSSTHASRVAKGLNGAYLGIALDAFGNYKSARYQGESRVNGIPYTGSSINNPINSIYNTGNKITIRGASQRRQIDTTVNRQNLNVNVSIPLGYGGYPVMITQSTNNQYGVVKNDDNNAIYTLTSTYAGNLFNISGGSAFTQTTDPNYRKAIIELYPVPNDVTGGGFYVTVKIQHGQQTDELISDFHYKESFYYQENTIIPNRYNSAIPTSDPLVVKLDASIPEFLKIGFAASTGELTNNNVIKNVKITLPGGAEANDDFDTAQVNTPLTLNPLLNDIAYAGVISRDMVGSSDYINPESFKFVLADGSAANSDYRHQSVEGLWEYNEQTGLVTFTPALNFVGNASIQYSIKGGLPGNTEPFADEAYRSLPAAITISVLPQIFAFPSTEICGENGIVKLFIEEAFTSSSYTYQWYKDGVMIAQATDSIYFASEGGIYSVEITGNGLSVFSLELAITISPGKSIEIPLIASYSGSYTICDPDGSVMLFLTNPEDYQAVPGVTYQWYIDDEIIPDATGIVYNTKVAGDYKLLVSYDDCLAFSAPRSVTKKEDGSINQPDLRKVPADAELCGVGSQVELRVQNASDYINPVYRWFKDNIQIPAAGSVYYATEGGDYFVIVIDEDCTANSEVVTVLERTASTSGLITISDEVICSGETAVLTPVASGVINPVFRWYQTATGGTAFYTGDSYTTPALLANTIFYISVSGDNYCEGTDVNARKTVTVTVNALPMPSFENSHAAACLNDSKTYTTQPGMSGYNWIISGTEGIDYTKTGGETTSNSITITWLTAGTRTVSVNYTNIEGCTADNPTTTNTIVHTSPIVSIASSEICIGSTTVLSSSGTGSWISNAPAIATVENNIVTGVAEGSATFTFTDASTGCTNTIDVNVHSAISVTAVSNICYNANGTVSLTASGGSGNYTYFIQEGGNWIENTVSPTNEFGGLAAGAYNFRVGDTYGCATEFPYILVAPTGDVTVSIAAYSDVSCNSTDDGSITITASSGNGAPYQYSYSADGGTSWSTWEDFAGNNTTVQITGLVAGTYVLKVRDNSNCESGITTPVIIRQNTTPVISGCFTSAITKSMDAGVCYAGGVYAMDDISVIGYPTPAVTYALYRLTGGNELIEPPYAIGTGTGYDYNYPAGTTRVVITASNICNTATCSFDVIVTDSEPPSITCMVTGNITKHTDAGQTYYTVSNGILDASATDNCPESELIFTYSVDNGTSITANTLNGVQFPVGIYNINWNVADNAGNENDCSFNLTVVSGDIPVIFCANSSFISGESKSNTIITLYKGDVALTTASPIIADSEGMWSIPFSDISGGLAIGDIITATLTENGAESQKSLPKTVITSFDCQITDENGMLVTNVDPQTEFTFQTEAPADAANITYQWVLKGDGTTPLDASFKVRNNSQTITVITGCNPFILELTVSYDECTSVCSSAIGINVITESVIVTPICAESPIVSGTSTANTLVKLYLVEGTNEMLLGETNSNAAGDWSITISSTLNEGDILVAKSGVCGSGVSAEVAVSPIPPAPILEEGVSRSVCSGASIEEDYLINLFTSVSGVTYNFYSDAAGTIPAVLPVLTDYNVSAGHTFYVRSEFENTQCESSVSTIYTLIINVNPLPSAPILKEGADRGVCSGASIERGYLMNLFTSVPGVTYNFYSDATGTTPATLPITTDYNVSISHTFYVRSEIVTTGCQSPVSTIYTLVIDVNPLPASPALITGADLSVCDGETITEALLETLVDYNDAEATVEFYMDENCTVAFTDIVTNYATATSHTVYAISRAIATVCATNATDALEIILTVEERPAPPALITGSDLSVCDGETITEALLATLVDYDDTEVTVEFYMDENCTVAFADIVTNYAIATSHTVYAISRTMTTGCATNATDALEIIITVNERPTAPILENDADTEVCSGGQLTLADLRTLFTPVSGVIYNFYSDASGTIPVALPITTDYDVSPNHTFYVRSEIEATGCESPTSTILIIDVNPLPSLPEGSLSAFACDEGTFDLSSALNAPPANIRYNYYRRVIQGGNPVDIAIQDATNAAYNANVTYWVESENNTTGCKSEKVEIQVTNNTSPFFIACPTAGYSVIANTGENDAEVDYMNDVEVGGTIPTITYAYLNNVGDTLSMANSYGNGFGYTGFRFPMGQTTVVITAVNTCNETGVECHFVILVEPRTFTVRGTVFPFVNTGDAVFDKLFTVTASLYTLPTSANPFDEIRTSTPLHKDTLVLYDGSVHVPGTPKNPGIIGFTNNPGVPVTWSMVGKETGEIDNTEVEEGKAPDTEVGLYTFENVHKGEYLLVISRPGYVTRYAKVNIENDGTLGHRELLAGDINNDRSVSVTDLSLLNANFSIYETDAYNALYDLDGEGNVGFNDIEIILALLRATFLMYTDSYDWLSNYNSGN